MPPAANDNQGLKIAVAVFVALSVLLAVATYFGFSNASYNYEKMEQANKDAQQAKTALATRDREFQELQAIAGYEKADPSAVVTKIKEDRKKLDDEMVRLRGEVEKVYAEYKNAAGDALPQQADQFADATRTSAEAFVSGQFGSLGSANTKMFEILSNQARLMSVLASDYAATRKDLESSNQVAQAKVDVEVKDKSKAFDDLQDVQKKHEEERQSLISRLDELQGRNNQLATEKTSLENQLAQTKDDWTSRYNKLMAQFRQARETLEKKETVLDKADGYITYVDYTRNEVRTTLTRRQGAREQLVFSVFDKDAPGLPTDSPKATIELIRVDDQGSIGRIVKQIKTIDPIRSGDQVYSPAFGQERPQTFALIGKIDVDRDGRDDREDLKRMIRAAGGEVVYDLPPPPGRESGELSPTVSWYVLDDRQPWRPGSEVNSGASSREEADFFKKRTDALQEARLAGIRPISIDRLLNYVGYSFGSPVVGRPEAANREAIDRLLKPRGAVAPKPSTPPASADDGFGDMADPGN